MRTNSTIGWLLLAAAALYYFKTSARPAPAVNVPTALSPSLTVDLTPHSTPAAPQYTYAGGGGSTSGGDTWDYVDRFRAMHLLE